MVVTAAPISSPSNPADEVVTPVILRPPVTSVITAETAVRTPVIFPPTAVTVSDTIAFPVTSNVATGIELLIPTEEIPA